MKSTGVVRRIDELGRIVIPKEIRKNLRIHEGENLEIFIYNEDVILKKFSIVKKLGDFANNFTDAIYSFVKHNIIITDTDNVIAISGPLKKDYIKKSISEEMFRAIERRENVLQKYKKKLKVIKEEEVECSYAITSIFNNGDVVGLVIMVSLDEQIDETELKVIQIAAQFLSKYIEE
ncbi:MAG: stage V sporulation T C-terminal domain-containing protein [Bacilli bacterium]